VARKGGASHSSDRFRTPFAINIIEYLMFTPIMEAFYLVFSNTCALVNKYMKSI
jgi:hypothetical protein